MPHLPPPAPEHNDTMMERDGIEAAVGLIRGLIRSYRAQRLVEGCGPMEDAIQLQHGGDAANDSGDQIFDDGDVGTILLRLARRFEAVITTSALGTPLGATRAPGTPPSGG